MNNEDKEFLREGIRVGLWAIVIIILILTLIRVNELKKELNEMKREHHVIIEYKEIPKDTIRIITPMKLVSARYGLNWN